MNGLPSKLDRTAVMWIGLAVFAAFCFALRGELRWLSIIPAPSSSPWPLG